MALFLRSMLMSIAALTVVYVCLLFYARARKHAQLQEAWLAAGQPGSRTKHVDEVLETYTATMRRKLVWGVYVLPLCGIAAIVLLTTYTA